MSLLTWSAEEKRLVGVSTSDYKDRYYLHPSLEQIILPGSRSWGLTSFSHTEQCIANGSGGEGFHELDMMFPIVGDFRVAILSFLLVLEGVK